MKTLSATLGQRMNIAYITTLRWGLTQFNYRDIDALTSRHHRVRIFALRNNEGLYNPRPEWEVVSIEYLALLANQLRMVLHRPLMYLSLLLHALRRGALLDLLIATHFATRMHDTDAIYVSWGDHKFFIGYYCKRMLNKPLIVCLHAYELYNNPNPRLFREALDYCDHVITVSEYNKRWLADHWAVPAKRVEVLYHSVDLEEYCYEPRVKVLMVGYFSEKKGHRVLFEALKLLNRPDIEAWIVGDITPAVDGVECRRLAQEFGVDGQVVFWGAQGGSALRALFRECDMLCTPSVIASNGDREGLPTVIPEAMAFSTPVIGTYHAGIPEAIDSVLVEENNPQALAEAIALLADSPEMRRELGTENRRVAEQRFSMANSDRLEVILADSVHAFESFTSVELPLREITT